MTRKELRRWLSQEGRLWTNSGWKYLKVQEISDRKDIGLWATALYYIWGNNDWSIQFTLHDSKPSNWRDFAWNKKSSTAKNKDGSKIITEGEISFFVPPGTEMPKTCRNENSIRAPLQSFRSLKDNIKLLAEYVNLLLK